MMYDLLDCAKWAELKAFIEVAAFHFMWLLCVDKSSVINFYRVSFDIRIITL